MQDAAWERGERFAGAGSGAPRALPVVDPDRIEVVRSPARRRSSSAGVRGGRVVIRVPAHLSTDEERRSVATLVERLLHRATRPERPTGLPRDLPARSTRERRGPRGDRLLVARADAVATRYLGDVRAAEVVWSHRMTTRWASCTTPPGRIRVSHRLADAPDAVLDNILLHELAHIVVPNHSRAFHDLADRDPASAAASAWLANRSRSELRSALGLD